MKKNRKKHLFIIGLACLLAALLAGAGLTGCNGCAEQTAETQTETTSVPSQAINNTIEWKGKRYTYNRDLLNILFLGIDNADPLAEKDKAGDAGQADCLMILSLDAGTKEGRILQINRNTMTKLDLYDKNGNPQGTVDGQITLQFSYDIGGASSCFAVKKTLSKLLFGLEIDGYFAMNLEGVSVINDALGGVDVLMKEDYTQIDPSFVKGETVHLKGAMAERFIRWRDTSEFDSVQNRMERQVDYVTALIDHMKQKGGSGLYDILSPYLDDLVLTDLAADQMNALKNYTYLTDEVEYLPGEMKMGEAYEEFYTNEEELQDLLIRMFYTEVKA